MSLSLIEFDLSNILLAIPTVPNGGNHTIEFTESARTKEAHKQNMLVTKALAHTGFRVLDDDKFYEEVCSSNSHS
jgi:hypothetical protein